MTLSTDRHRKRDQPPDYREGRRDRGAACGVRGVIRRGTVSTGEEVGARPFQVRAIADFRGAKVAQELEREAKMISPDQDLTQFPPWIWPYIDVARFADISRDNEKFRGGAAFLATPQPAIAAHVTAIIAAATLKKMVAGLSLKDPDVQRQFEAAAAKALTVAIDDCGNGRRKPWPQPPRHIQLAEIAGQLAVAAAELDADEVLHRELTNATLQLRDQALKG